MEEDKTSFLSPYTIDDAIADGLLVELFKNRWPELSGGIPIVAASRLYNEVSLAALREIWNRFVQWHQFLRPTLPEKERQFRTLINRRTVMVVDEGWAYTFCFQEDN